MVVFFSDDKNYQAAIDWALKTLSSLNYELISDLIEPIKDTPFSYVAVFETNQGKVYLKATPILITEPKIIKILADKFHATVPIIIAEHPFLNIFLMKDAGSSLRSILKKNFNTSLVCAAINQFIETQHAVSLNINELIDIGVPDWRVSALPRRYQKFISEQKELLLMDGLTLNQYEELQNLQITIDKLCQRLSSYAIKETMVQPDFNDNNILYDEKNNLMTLIDLGEIVITHPFFSHINMLYQLKKHHRLNEAEDNYQRIKECFFSHYQSIETKDRIEESFKIASSLWGVYGVLAYSRLMDACGSQQIITYQPGKLATILRDLLIDFNSLSH